MLTINLIENSYDKRGFMASVKTAARQIRDEALEEFFRTVLSELPVWSGAAKATLIPLGRLLKISFDISPKVKPPFDNPNEHGIAAGKRKGKAKKINASWEYGFVFEHSLFHYWLNENFLMHYGPDKKPTPWETMKKGSERYRDFIDKNSSTILPKVWEFLENY